MMSYAVRLTRDNLNTVARYMRTHGHGYVAAVDRDDHIKFYVNKAHFVYADIGDWIVDHPTKEKTFVKMSHEKYERITRPRGT